MSALHLDHPVRWIAGSLVALLLAVGLFAGFRFWTAIHKLDPNAGVGAIVGLAQNHDDTPGTLAYKIKHGQRANILMLGYGGGQHDGSYLTDSILIVSIQGPDRVALTSVPRDTYVNLSRAFLGNQQYSNKVNVAYEIPLIQGALGKVKPEYDQGFSGAGKLASQVIGDYIGQPIDYWVGVDFTAFKKVVDAVNGVDVVNPYTLDDDQYPLGETSGYTHIHFDKGPLHLDGDHALIYVRERHADSDFGRSRRQQQVLAAIKEKALSIGAIPKLFTLLDALQDNVKTNLAINDLKTFAGVAAKINTSGAHHVSIDNTNFQWDTYSDQGAYILLPRDHTLGSLRHFIANELPPVAALKEHASIQFSSSLAEASDGYSLAGIAGSAFRMLSFTTVAPDTVPQAPAVTEVHDYSGGRATQTVAWLAKYFNGSVITEAPRAPSSPGPTPTVGAGATPEASGPGEVVVVLGTDFAGAFNDTAAVTRTPTYVPPPTRRPSPSPSLSTVPSPSPQPSLEPSTAPSAKPPLCPPICPKPSPSPSPKSSGGGPSPSPKPSPT